jgi:predicted alpha/beta hydrolase
LDIAREKITIEAADGCQLAARWWPGSPDGNRTLLFVSGLAAPQEYLHFFASYLAQREWNVLTFDYRSVAGSRSAKVDSTATLDDWVNLDLPAAVAAIKQRTSSKFLGVVAHSIGGQLLGQSPIRSEIDGALFISAQRGIRKHYQGVARFRVEWAYTVFPMLIQIFGNMPPSNLTFPVECSGQAVRQWVEWGRRGVFVDRNGRSVEERFAEFTGPLTAVTIEDDGYYAPSGAVEALTRVYKNADVDRVLLSPKEFGAESVGHFGFFHRHAPRTMWERAVSWLNGLEDRARRREEKRNTEHTERRRKDTEKK